MFRPTHGALLLRRAWAQSGRRCLHGDPPSRGKPHFLDLTPCIHRGDVRVGMDMTHAPGYQVAADDGPSPGAHEKLAEFAVRQGRLTSDQVLQAHGYIWIGNVLYPSGSPSHEFSFSWVVSHDVDGDEDGETDAVHFTEPDNVSGQEHSPTDHDIDAPTAPNCVERRTSSPAVQAKRRYTGGQARRIRKERERIVAKRAARVSKRRPIRKPHNDVPSDDDS